MAFKEVSQEELATSLRLNISEIREKQKLIKLIIKIRKEKNLSQTLLAKKVGVTQSRIAQIESGIGTFKITFDILLSVLISLGYDFKIQAKPAA